MKYEISQQQYVDFLNTLTYTQQAARTATLPNSSAGTGALVSNNANRNGIDIQTSGINASQPAVYACNLDGDVNYNEADDGQHIACNYLSWDDLDAYLDWAALRPMSELEFEKSCRGNLTPNAGEYPWGTATAVKPTGLTNGGNASEVASNSTANMAFDITSIGPLRTGIFATGSTNRNGSGAGYYGNMDLGGNLWERVVTLGKDEGRTFSGNHGNGTLTTQGYADVTGWPVAAGTGWRGGAYNLPDSTALAARRTVASNGDNNRSANAGGRGARTDPAGIVTDGLVLWLDAGITSSYPTSGTSWTDLSGNRNNGTLTNGPTFNSANGGSIVFDGVNDYVSNTMPNPGSVPITFDFWLNSNTSTPIGLFDTAPSSMNVLRNYGAGNIEWWNSDPTVSLGVSALTWTNITIEYSFTTNRTMKYYRNGNLITTATGSASSSFAWTSLIFGNINGGNDGWYSGKISTIKIYNRALSAAEVLQNFNALKTRFGL
jgi:formylglycine-generating enzyme required for sulfatase activity